MGSKKVMLHKKDNPLEMDFTESRPSLIKRFVIGLVLISLAACAFISALLMM